MQAADQKMPDTALNSSNVVKLEWRYLLGMCLPVTCFMGLYFRGVFSPGSLYFGFLIVPLMDRYFFRGARYRPKPTAPTWFTRAVLYLNVPVLYMLSWYYYTVIDQVGATEWFFLSLNLGIVYGSNGINVAHELGHRKTLFDRAMAFLLLLPSYYVHFTDAHNLGHHVKVGRPDDPASAPRGTSFYAFLPAVISGEWRDVISIEQRRLDRKGKSYFSLENKVVWYILADLVWAGLVFTLWGWFALLSSFILALAGVALLALINYIEHYGLVRVRRGKRYERAASHHSWDSAHYLGRTLLYQLPLHADHHLNEGKEYPQLDHLEDSPRLPCGYPESMIRALVPPLWKQTVHPMLQAWESKHLGD